MNRLTAQEAAMIAEDMETISLDGGTEKILKMVENVARKGEKQLIVTSLTRRAFDDLIDLGYIITVGKKYTITW